MKDINLDECTTTIDKIILTSKSFNHSFNKNNIYDYNMTYSSIKCFNSLPSITHLEIRGQNLIKIHKTIFLNLINLISIDLSDNKLLKISKNFVLFKNLKSLKLNNNQISFLPSFISELTQLEHLSISKNNISLIPTSIQDLLKLSYFDFSYNKVDNIPIEFGLLNSLNILHIDSNFFTKIPTTFCYLKKLNELSFDWLEFINPPYYKNIKESIGKTIISFMLKTLENMLKKNILYCDFNQFVEEMSVKNYEKNNNIEIYDSLLNRSGINNELKNSQLFGSSITAKSNFNNINNTNNNGGNNNNSKFLKIFNAIEGGYYGVVKSMLESENGYEYLTIKNIENKTPLNYCLSKNIELIDLFLSKIKEQKIELDYTYLFKAIKLRNPELVKKLIYLGAKVDSIDDRGKTVFHILFSVFTKNISKCILIGDFLLDFPIQLNKLDNEGWAPIHLAAKRSSKECFLWVIEKNKKLKKEGKEEFDINLRGKNDWTPLHLAVHLLRIEESMILLEYGADIFARNYESKTPKQVSSSNYVFSKLLTYYEFLYLYNKYIFEIKSNIHYFTEKKSPCNNKNLLNKNEEKSLSIYDDNIIINNSSTIYSFLNKKMPSVNHEKNKDNTKNNIINISKQKKIIKLKNFTNDKKINFIYSIKSNLFNQPNLEHINDLKEKNENIKNFIEDNNKNNILKVSLSSNNVPQNLLIEENEEKIVDKNDILSSYISNFEKIKYITKIKLNKNCSIDSIKHILENIINENQFNMMLISDICNYSLQNLLYDIIPTLEIILTNKIIKKNNFIKKEIENTIKALELLKKNQKNYMKKKTKINKINKHLHLSPLNKPLSKKIFETENEENIFLKNAEISELEENIGDTNENISVNEIFKSKDFNQIIDTKKNLIKNKNAINEIKLFKGNILDIDVNEKKFSTNNNKFNYNNYKKGKMSKISKINNKDKKMKKINFIKHKK